MGAATAALGNGNVAQGAAGAITGEALSGVMQDYLRNHDIDPNSANGRSLMQLGSAAVGAAVGGGSGAASALNGELYNRQLHPDETARLNALKNGKSPEEQQRINGNYSAPPLFDYADNSNEGRVVGPRKWLSRLA